MSLVEKRRAAEILLIEDSPADARLTREALEMTVVEDNLHHVADGQEALEFLFKRGDYLDAPTPDLILLDLNLPRKHGYEILSELKQDETLKRIPVIVLTTSPHERDIHRAYDLHANCYVTKPMDFGKFVDVIHYIEQFWVRVAQLPPQPANRI